MVWVWLSRLQTTCQGSDRHYSSLINEGKVENPTKIGTQNRLPGEEEKENSEHAS